MRQSAKGVRSWSVTMCGQLPPGGRRLQPHLRCGGVPGPALFSPRSGLRGRWALLDEGQAGPTFTIRRTRRVYIFRETSILNEDDAIHRAGGEIRMRHHDDGEIVHVDRVAQQREDVVTGGGIEVAGRLVGKEESRPHDECPRNGDTLHLAARQLRRAMVGPIGEPDRRERLHRAAFDLASTGSFGEQRQRHVVSGRHRGEQVEELKDEAHVTPAKGRRGLLIHCREILVNPTAQRFGPTRRTLDLLIGAALAHGAWSLWLWLKLAFVAGLLVMHLLMLHWRDAFALDSNRHPQRFFRIMNEAPTLLMIGIVICVVVKPF